MRLTTLSMVALALSSAGGLCSAKCVTTQSPFGEADLCPEDFDSEPCELNISHDIGHKQPPLVMYAGTNRTIRALHATNGRVHLAPGQPVLISCPGIGNSLKHVKGNRSELVARCAGGQMLRTEYGETMPMRRFECARWPEHRTKADGRCLWGQGDSWLTGFEVRSVGFVDSYQTCFDRRSERTLYVRFTLTIDASAAQRHVSRSHWRGREMFTGDPGVLYKKSVQHATIGRLLGSVELADRYVHQASGDVFLARGHLAAKSDFLLGAVQTATFRYANAAPQWQTFNGNNWNALENDMRAFAERYGHDLTCYAGTYGTATLPNAEGVETELFLGANQTIPVPRMYWKVLYDERTQLGVVFVGLNNPHQAEDEVEQDVRCRNVCAELGPMWSLTWQADSVRRGYSYCCDVNDFRENFVGVLPGFAVVGLLR